MSKRYNSILETIGNTPVVKLNAVAPTGVNVFVKIESFNPMGSVKDRMALAVVEDAERSGALQAGQTVVEATSGNTGIALAMVCARKGYPLVITMAENFSVERRKMMRYLGAEVVLTPASAKGSGMVAKAEELARQHGWWQPKQFENPANAEAHRLSTAVEILEDFADITLDYWVSGFGTGGTYAGVSSVLREQSPATKIVVCEPDNSRLIGAGIAQPKNDDGSHSASHPMFRPHLMQGWTPDFIPPLVERALGNDAPDEMLAIPGAQALKCCQELAQKEGIFVGISAGATLAGALQLAETAPPNSNILCILPDTGERYLSTPMFDDIEADMNERELAISCSTNGYRFDISPTITDEQPVKPVAADPVAVKEIESILCNEEQTVVMFGLEWCEFCWSVRKMMAKYSIDYQSIDLDSLLNQENDRGGKLRGALTEKTGWNTFPQIFIGGHFLGGCTDLFDSCNNGELRTILDGNKVAYNKAESMNPYSLLPTWLHPR
mgnify:CR=1 FL=1